MSQTQRLLVNEIFYSLQGEGSRAGARCTFIRLTGCHLRCDYCDTRYAFSEGDWMTLEEILDRVRAYNCPTVEVTGGEPLLQPGIYALLERLLEEFETVLLETSGTISVADVDPRVVRIVDFKCPSSGESERNDWSNVDLLRTGDEVKFVIGTREDYVWARDAIRRYDLPARCSVLLSLVSLPPNRGSWALQPAELANWLLEDRLDVRLGLQLHKIIWPSKTRGV